MKQILSISERKAKGKQLRLALQRGEHAKWTTKKNRDSVLPSVKAATIGRVPALLPLKMGRMALSALAFYRGSAGLMAEDLSTLPVTGLNVQICGDAHVRNLGAFGTPEGHLVFDLNDFDETIVGPWEWDLKRLATSFVLAGREAGHGEGGCQDAVRTLVRSYQKALNTFAEMKVLELAWHQVVRHSQNPVIHAIMSKAEHVTPKVTLKKLTTKGLDGSPVFHDEPPVLRHVPTKEAQSVIASLTKYRTILSAGRQLIFDSYHPVDVAFKVVGTGSVGTRDFAVLLLGTSKSDALFLQVKESVESCYAPFLKHSHSPAHDGQRVAQGQQRIQAFGDPFLGWTTVDEKTYLVRQLSDHKASVDPTELRGEALLEYADVCGEVLAKAHARTGDAAVLAGYLGGSDKVVEAMTGFAASYADQVDEDFATFAKAIKKGIIKAEKIASK